MKSKNLSFQAESKAYLLQRASATIFSVPLLCLQVKLDDCKNSPHLP